MMQLTKQGAQKLMIEYYQSNLCVPNGYAEMLVAIMVKADTDGLVAFVYEKGRQEAQLENIFKEVEL